MGARGTCQALRWETVPLWTLLKQQSNPFVKGGALESLAIAMVPSMGTHGKSHGVLASGRFHVRSRTTLSRVSPAEAPCRLLLRRHYSNSINKNAGQRQYCLGVLFPSVTFHCG